jgi:hypothetical protein
MHPALADAPWVASGEEAARTTRRGILNGGLLERWNPSWTFWQMNVSFLLIL